MSTPLKHKSTIQEIQTRFDNDVERFSQLETGQQATIDAPLVLDLVAETAALHLKPNDTILDIGCGAGNFTLRVLQEVHPLACHLVDLSQPMLTRASERIEASGVKYVQTYQSDLRDLDFEEILLTVFLQEPFYITFATTKTGRKPLKNYITG